MRVVIDIEANGLENPSKIWVIVCKDIDTGEYSIFRENDIESFITYSKRVSLWIGHNILGYDFPVLAKLHPGFNYEPDTCIDTLIISKLVDYPRSGHSIENYGEEFGLEKITFNDFDKYSIDMETYCIRDVDICERVYRKYSNYISKPEHRKSIQLEHRFQLVCNDLHNNGFAFNIKKATELLEKVTGELEVLDKDILEAFQPKLKPIRVVTPRETKYGTISLSSIPKTLRKDIADLTIAAPFTYCSWSDFNPSSHSQIVKVLGEAGWRPVDKTETHKDTEREYNKLSRQRGKDKQELETLAIKLRTLQKTGWKVNEANLETLPPSAPVGARLLAKRILLESRRRTLTEWLPLVDAKDGRIHGKFYGLGAWTHRMAHQNPNTSNIPNSIRVSDGKINPYGKELRSLWQAPKGRLLIGVDAEAIQLRVFAHMIDDPVLTDAIVNGKKSDGTDPHSLNKKYFGEFCKTRDAAKHSLYAIFFGGGAGKVAEIMSCKKEEAEYAISSLLEKYPGLRNLQENVFPIDAKRGWFIGIDGRKVRIPGDTVSYRKHLCMSGYLQNGEAVVMKNATLKWWQKLESYDARLVNFVHDEWQTECPNDMKIALAIAEMQADSLRLVGEELGLRCPLAGSYWNDKARDYTIDTNWSKTH